MVTPGMLAFDDQEWNGGTPQVLNVSIENVGEESIAMDDLTVVLTTGTQFMLGAVEPAAHRSGGDGHPAGLPSIRPTPVSCRTPSPSRSTTTRPATLTHTVSLTGTGTGPTATPTRTATPTCDRHTHTDRHAHADSDADGDPDRHLHAGTGTRRRCRGRRTQPLTDGLLLLRYLFGFGGTTFVTGAVGDGCGRCDAPEIEVYIASIIGLLDVDGVNGAKALTYGLLLLRYLFGFRGATLVTGAVENGCSRCTPETIEPYIAGLL